MVKNQRETSGVKGGPQLAASKEIGAAITRQWILSTTWITLEWKFLPESLDKSSDLPIPWLWSWETFRGKSAHPSYAGTSDLPKLEDTKFVLRKTLSLWCQAHIFWRFSLYPTAPLLKIGITSNKSLAIKKKPWRKSGGGGDENALGP